MKKNNKGMVIFLLIIIALSLNYMIYQYIFIPKNNNLKAVEAEYISKENKLAELIKIKANVENLKNENEELKKSIEEIEKLIAKDIDTPQLVYDFYESCKKYDVEGEEVKFSLIPEELPKDEKEAKEKEKEAQDNIIRLEILLNVNGEKNNIEKYIRNLDDITKRKLNVKSIRLSSKDNDTISAGLPSESIAIVRSNNIEAEINFYHYLKLNNEQIERIKKYDFYPNIIGFDSIPQMFR